MAIVLIGLSMSQPALAEEILPEPGLLEYLGTLVEDDGNYLDPLDMEAMTTLSNPEARSTSNGAAVNTGEPGDTEELESPAATGEPEDTEELESPASTGDQP